MDCKTAVLFFIAVLVVLLVTNVEGRTKKVVIHVPYKVKKIKHTHTVYKTIHHHHHDSHMDHVLPSSEEHEHFHHMHLHDIDPIGSIGQHSQPVPGIGIPEFLPDVPLDVPLNVPDVPKHEIPGFPPRHIVPLYRRNKVNNSKSL